MNQPSALFPDVDLKAAAAESAAAPRPRGTPRLRRPERQQGEFRWESLDQLLPPEHQARLVWAYVERLDLTPWLQDIQAVAGQAGRDANDPRLLVALWLYATIDGVGSARALDRLCREHLAYRWLCGGVSMNYHTLADFRTQRSDDLSALLTASAATLLHQGLVSLERVAQDGMKVRASAGASSFRRQPSLERCRQEAQAQVDALRNQLDEDDGAASRRQQKARERAARERLQRVEQALQEHARLDERRREQQRTKGTKYDPAQLRCSTTDPEAQRMQMADGGTRPGWNVQFTTTTAGGVVVGVDVTNQGNDAGQLTPQVAQVQERFGQTPQEWLVDGGFTTLDDIEAAATQQVQVLGPVKDAAKKQERGEDPYQARPKDGPGVAAWRQRMGTAAAQQTYRLRGQTAEWVNAGCRQRGLYQVRVRGQAKVLAVALWFALAHNLLRSYALQAAAAAATGDGP